MVAKALSSPRARRSLIITVVRISFSCAVLGAFAGLATRADVAEPSGPPPGTTYYSTAAPPRDHPGPGPVLRALADLEPPKPGIPDLAPIEPPRTESESPDPPRLATVPLPRDRLLEPRPAPPLADRTATAPSAAEEPATLAKRAIAECRANYQRVQDYTCTFLKRERIDGRLTPQNVMMMKARTQPLSFYMKFQTPHAGREAIYITGRNGGRALVHDVGLGKLIAGTLALDPRGGRAMEDCRHPITEAGIGHLIDQIARRWEAEMKPGETRVVIQPRVLVNKRPSTMIESTHPQRHPSYLFYQVKVYIDHEIGLPIRFEAYDWPRRPGGVPELVEEYTFLNLRLNVGLSDPDFDTSNPSYSFGRF